AFTQIAVRRDVFGGHQIPVAVELFSGEHRRGRGGTVAYIRRGAAEGDGVVRRDRDIGGEIRARGLLPGRSARNGGLRLVHRVDADRKCAADHRGGDDEL